MTNTSLSKSFILIASAASVAFAAASENQVRVELIADAQSIAPGETFRAGVIFHLPKRAHIYWRNPGDSGLATGIEWRPSEDSTFSELRWPNPSRFELEGLDDVNHGYKDEVLLYSDVTVKEDATGNLTLSVRAYWLLCLDDGECIPEDMELTLEIPVATKRKSSEHFALFETFSARVPRAIAGYRIPITIQTEAETGELTVATAPPWEIVETNSGEEANFYPDAGSAWRRVEPSPGGATPQAIFRANETGKPVFSGALTIPVRNTRENKSRTLFISVSE